jgi:hypothetical protein
VRLVPVLVVAVIVTVFAVALARPVNTCKVAGALVSLPVLLSTALMTSVTVGLPDVFAVTVSHNIGDITTH